MVISFEQPDEPVSFSLPTAKKCKALKELNISGVDVGTSSIKALSISCTELEV